jgi:peptide/nickel transport system permease protein
VSDAATLPGPRRTLAVSPVVARIVSWPLAAALLGVGVLWRTAVALARGLSTDATERLRAYASGAGRYLAFRSDDIPPFSGRVAGEGESRGPWNEAKHRLKKSRIAMLSWIGVALYLYVGVAAQAGWTGDAQEQDRTAVYQKPDLFEAGSKHPLGTDILGRDVLRLALRGTSTALWIGFVAALLSCAIGAVLGALAGYFGRWVDLAVVWLYTTVESIPYLLLILAFSYVFKANEGLRAWYSETFLRTGLGISMGLFVIVLAVGLTSWVGVCRTVRGEFLRLRERDYVTAARALGVSTRRTIFRHVFPNAFHLVLVSYSLLFIGAVKVEAILTFLGIGVEQGEASWGQMIAQARLELIRHPDPVWWQLTTATVFMFGLVLCVNLFADALRDALDPRLRV